MAAKRSKKGVAPKTKAKKATTEKKINDNKKKVIKTKKPPPNGNSESDGDGDEFRSDIPGESLEMGEITSRHVKSEFELTTTKARHPFYDAMGNIFSAAPEEEEEPDDPEHFRINRVSSPNLDELFRMYEKEEAPHICYVQLQSCRLQSGKSKAREWKLFGMQIISIPQVRFPHPWPATAEETREAPREPVPSPFISLANLKYLVMKSVHGNQFNSSRYSEEVSAVPILPALNFQFITTNSKLIGEVVLTCNHDLWCALGAAQQDKLRLSLVATWTQQDDTSDEMGEWVEDMNEESDSVIQYS